ncbi:hypothetical protein [Carboxydothermus pertinax]|uniref:Uncharacterized protein n=1 Tax=Carboxydothermus pertinax TaxID=870242 RepID=A0A1L8CRS7_9THEO|nr:hypothetical protein [Carboxydothermus pertinax]GAV21628.1 hypothetical protein cpu_01380 [Carboxydothermus pertinax]
MNIENGQEASLGTLLNQSGLPIVINNNGVLNIMDKNQVISGNTIQNGIFNTGDHNNQNISNTSEIDAMISELLSEINSKLSGQEKQDAINDVKMMREALQNGNMDRAKRIYGLLSDFVKTFASAMTIAQHFGWLS